MSTVAQVEAALAAVPLLSRLSASQRERLAKLATLRVYPTTAVIVRQGDTSMSFYVVVRGKVRVEQDGEGGARLPIRELGPGGSFGEMGLIDDLPRSATIVALEPTECALLAKWDFRNELRSDPDVALALLPILTQRIRELEALAQRASPSSGGSL
jgi:CRP/FNR family transcriptional regulator, cyclic AMP receptor protein